DGQARGRNRGGRSKSTIDPDAPPASTGMSAWDRVAAANAKRRDGDNGPRVWFSLMGIDFTTVKAVVLVVILSLIVGGITWWFTGPGDGLQMVQAQPVTRLIAMDRLSRQENKGIPNTVFKSGQSAPQANATP